MIEIQCMLCPIDFSDCSRRALDHAVAVARWYDASVTALYVVPPIPQVAWGPAPVAFQPMLVTDADREQMLADVRRFVEPEAAPGVALDVVIREGHAAEEILTQAGAMKADLLVLGTHGLSGFERLVLGSVTETVLRKARCPVLTVPRRVPDAAPSAPGLFKEILCAVDFSSSSLHGLNHAMSLAEEADAHLTVLHVISREFEEPDPATAIATDQMSLSDYRRQYEDALRNRLVAAVPEAVAAYCSVDSLVAHGKPWREILRVAGERKSELIVMGVQGRGPADLMFFGSTAQHVVREAACPVLTIRQS